MITDFVMPGVGGRELAARLRGVRRGLKVMFISGYSEGIAGPASRWNSALARPSLLALTRTVLDS